MDEYRRKATELIEQTAEGRVSNDKAVALTEAALCQVATAQLEALQDEFRHKATGLCGLCGNSGRIDTTGMRSAAGVKCSIRVYCICPSGRAWKAGEEAMRNQEAR